MTPERLAEIGLELHRLEVWKYGRAAAELLAEVTRLLERESFLINMHHAETIVRADAEAECARLAAENAELRKDAERLTAILSAVTELREAQSSWERQFETVGVTVGDAACTRLEVAKAAYREAVSAAMQATAQGGAKAE